MVKLSDLTKGLKFEHVDEVVGGRRFGRSVRRRRRNVYNIGSSSSDSSSSSSFSSSSGAGNGGGNGGGNGNGNGNNGGSGD